MEPRLIVHGGAWTIRDKYVDDHVQGVQQAVTKVYPDLQRGITALDAVEATVKLLEADPTFDAGMGAFLNAQGEIELDAIIMDGISLNFGAVAGVQNLLHPVSLARQVMEQTEHCFLIGNGAQQFARQIGFPELDPRSLLTPRELEFYEQIKNDPSFQTHQPFEPKPGDTVGAVAMDKWGNLASATSTGGTPRKLPGRVGDSPIIGAGAYADNELGAVSATGWGESIMKIVMSKTACDLLKFDSAEKAAQKSVALLEKKVNGWGGIIIIDKNGRYGFAHNTTRMAFAYARSSGEVVARIKALE